MTTQFHKYSTGYEWTAGSGYTAIQARRVDRAVSNMDSGDGLGCTQYFHGDPVYQDEWINITSNGNWVENGTGHQCNDAVRYWFWAYGFEGDFYPTVTASNIVIGDTHYWRIIRSAGSHWDFTVDGTVRGTLTWSVDGIDVYAGLESWNATAHVTQFPSYELLKARNDGAFSSWGGNDVTIREWPPMCGDWLAGDSWRAGENPTVNSATCV